MCHWDWGKPVSFDAIPLFENVFNANLYIMSMTDIPLLGDTANIYNTLLLKVLKLVQHINFGFYLTNKKMVWVITIVSVTSKVLWVLSTSVKNVWVVLTIKRSMILINAKSTLIVNDAVKRSVTVQY